MYTLYLPTDPSSSAHYLFNLCLIMSEVDVDSAGVSASVVQEDSPVPTSDTLSTFPSEAGIIRTQLNNLVRGGSARPSQNVPHSEPSQIRLSRLGLFSEKEPMKQGEVDWETISRLG